MHTGLAAPAPDSSSLSGRSPSSAASLLKRPFHVPPTAAVRASPADF